jgi:hypothetical protein
MNDAAERISHISTLDFLVSTSDVTSVSRHGMREVPMMHCLQMSRLDLLNVNMLSWFDWLSLRISLDLLNVNMLSWFDWLSLRIRYHTSRSKHYHTVPIVKESAPSDVASTATEFSAIALTSASPSVPSILTF